MTVMRRLVALAALGGTFVTLVATSRAMPRGLCSAEHPEDRARYLVTSTCGSAYLAEVALQEATCAVDVVPLDAGLPPTTGRAWYDALARGDWTFDLATLEAASDGGQAAPRTRNCDVTAPDAGTPVLDFACEVMTVGACSDDPGCRDVASCRGTLTPQP